MDKQLHDTWGVIRNVIFIAILLMPIFFSIYNMGKPVPGNIENIQVQTESID